LFSCIKAYKVRHQYVNLAHKPTPCRGRLSARRDILPIVPPTATVILRSEVTKNPYIFRQRADEGFLTAFGMTRSPDAEEEPLEVSRLGEGEQHGVVRSLRQRRQDLHIASSIDGRTEYNFLQKIGRNMA
jgi:hypothetical protein